MFKNKNRYIVIVSLLVLASGGYAFYNTISNRKIKNNTSANTIQVRLKWTNNPQFAGMYVAQEKGFYANEGLTVSFLERGPNTESIGEEVGRGAVQFAITNPHELLYLGSKHTPIKAIATIFQVSPSAIISLANNPVKNPKDLRNKVIGIPTDLPGQMSLYYSLLRTAKVPVNTVTFAATEKDQLNYLLTKKVDAVGLYRFEAYQLEQSHTPYTMLFPENFGITMTDDVIITNQTMLSEHPEQVQKFIRATLRGWEYTLAHPEEAAAIASKVSAVHPGDTAYALNLIQESMPLIQPTPSSTIGYMSNASWEEMYNRLKETLLLDNFDYQALYTNEFVKK